MEPVSDHKVTQILLWRHHQAGADPVWRPQLLQKTADGAAVGTLHGAWGEGLQVQVLDYQTTDSKFYTTYSSFAVIKTRRPLHTALWMPL